MQVRDKPLSTPRIERGKQGFFARLARREGTSFSTFMLRVARASGVVLALCLVIGVIASLTTGNVGLACSFTLGLAAPVVLTLLGGVAMLAWPAAFSAWAALLYVVKAMVFLGCLTLAAPLLATQAFALGFALGILVDLTVISLVFLRPSGK